MANFTAVGVEAQVSGFSAFISQLGQMDKAIANTGKSVPGVASQFTSLGSSVMGFGAVLGGVALAGVTALAGGLVYLGSVAMGEYAKYERLQLSIQNLAAREIAQGTIQEQQKTVMAQLTAKEVAELTKLQTALQGEAIDRQVSVARIQEQQERIRQLTVQYGENGLVVIKERAELEKMNFQLQESDRAAAGMSARVSELTAKDGQLVTVTEKVRVGQMSMSDAMAQAGPKAKELLNWISKLAIESPFNQEGVALAFKTAMTYGFTAEQAQILTQAEVDFAAATGAGIDSANMIALALGQMQAKGKVSGQEIIQLTNAGIGVNKILDDMGFTLDDVSAGLVDSDKFIQAVISDMQVFEGAAKDQANTFSGLLSSLEELKNIGLREFFTGTFKAIQPYLTDFVNTINSPATMAALSQIGSLLGGAVANGMKKIIAIGSQISSTFAAGGAGGLVGMLGITPELQYLGTKIAASLTELGNAITNVLKPAFDSISSGGALDMLNNAIIFVNQNFEAFKGAIIGVGAVLVGSAIAAIIAGIVSALAAIGPVVLIVVAAAAALGAAWNTNFMNIQGVFASFVAFWTAQWPTIQAAAMTAWVVLQGVFNGIVAALQPLGVSFNQLTTQLAAMGISWGDIGNTLLTAVGIVAAGIGVLIVGIISVITSLASAIMSGITAVITVFNQFLGAVQTVGIGIGQILQGDIITGVTNMVTGIGTALNTLMTGPMQVFLASMQGFVNSIVAFWQGLYQTLVGGSIVPDLVNAIITWFTTLVGSVTDIVGGLITTVQTLFGSLFGSIGSGGLDLSALTSVLPQAMTQNMTLVSQLQTQMATLAKFIVTTLALSFTMFATIAFTQLTMIITTTQMLDALLVSMATISFPLLGMAAILAAQMIISSFATVNGVLMLTMNIVNQLAAAFRSMASSAVAAANAIKSGFQDAKKPLEDMYIWIQKLIIVFEQLTAAAEAAARAASSAATGNASASARAAALNVPTERFARGTGAQGFTVPGGYGNDNFGMRVSSGEQVYVSPRGQTIEQMVMPRIMQQYAAATPANITLNFGPTTVQSPLDIEMVAEAVKRKLTGAF